MEGKPGFVPRETSNESAVTHSGGVRPFGGSEKGKNFETKPGFFSCGLFICGSLGLMGFGCFL